MSKKMIVTMMTRPENARHCGIRHSDPSVLRPVISDRQCYVGAVVGSPSHPFVRGDSEPEHEYAEIVDRPRHPVDDVYSARCGCEFESA
jgi:hypothetical protein